LYIGLGGKPRKGLDPKRTSAFSLANGPEFLRFPVGKRQLFAVRL
jgi:hypothetical protein